MVIDHYPALASVSIRASGLAMCAGANDWATRRGDALPAAMFGGTWCRSQRESCFRRPPGAASISEEHMDVDWPLASFIAVALLVATLACRLLVSAILISYRAIRALALDRNRREPGAGLIPFDVDERSLP